METSRIPNEVISEKEVTVIEEITIPDALEALLEQERLGSLVIHRYHELTEKKLEWIKRVEADGIKKMNLIQTPGPMADYYRGHYPESWAMAQQAQNA